MLADNVKWDDDRIKHSDKVLEDIEEECNEGNNSTLLMLRRVCMAPMRHDDQPWLRTNIFTSIVLLRERCAGLS